MRDTEVYGIVKSKEYQSSRNTDIYEILKSME